MDYDKQQQPPNYNNPGQPMASYSNPGQYNNPGYPPAGPAGGTTVIVNQPMPGAPGGAPRMWTTGVCDCCEDIGICMCGAFCLLCLACQTSTDMGESACVPCCVPGADIVMRTKWRTQENIHGSILDDCMTAWCCGPCALCQLAREVKRKKTGMLVPRG